ncbi:MAG: mechanosensitive ion channel family protein, partial [Tannerellaceae bacterium]|nr:mechanosensitive ion channel family protein [Tannerellaceae bacterium]
KYIARKLIDKYRILFQKSEMRGLLIRRVISILLNILFVFVFAIIWGLEPHNLLVGLSSVFAVIGVAMFAQWSVLSNITAGIIMYFGEPFRIGNRIHIIDKDIPIIGVIEDIRTFYTYIRTEKNELIAISNNQFLQKIVSLSNEK